MTTNMTTKALAALALILTACSSAPDAAEPKATTHSKLEGCEGAETASTSSCEARCQNEVFGPKWCPPEGCAKGTVDDVRESGRRYQECIRSCSMCSPDESPRYTSTSSDEDKGAETPATTSDTATQYTPERESDPGSERDTDSYSGDE